MSAALSSSSDAKRESVGLENIVITAQLQRRPARQVDVHRENAAFRELSAHLGEKPEAFLQRLVELTLELCAADTVGISVEQVNEKGEKIFRWVAMAGELKYLIGGTTPRNYSPCGVCVDQNQPLLMEHIGRYYPDFAEAPLPFVEALLFPWEVMGGPAGTLWIVAHSDRRKFDREDVRLMSCLSAFASGAVRLKQTLLEAERAVAAKQIVSDMAHHINNPLQGAILALSCLSANTDLNPEVSRLVSIAEVMVNRVADLSSDLLRKAV